MKLKKQKKHKQHNWQTIQKKNSQKEEEISDAGIKDKDEDLPTEPKEKKNHDNFDEDDLELDDESEKRYSIEEPKLKKAWELFLARNPLPKPGERDSDVFIPGIKFTSHDYANFARLIDHKARPATDPIPEDMLEDVEDEQTMRKIDIHESSLLNAEEGIFDKREILQKEEEQEHALKYQEENKEYIQQIEEEIIKVAANNVKPQPVKEFEHYTNVNPMDEINKARKSFK